MLGVPSTVAVRTKLLSPLRVQLGESALRTYMAEMPDRGRGPRAPDLSLRKNRTVTQNHEVTKPAFGPGERTV